MSTKKEKTTKTKQAGPRTAQKLVNQAEAHLQITESQVITPKKGEVGISSSGSKVNIGILRGRQPTNTTAQRAATSKSTSEINITDVPDKKWVPPKFENYEGTCSNICKHVTMNAYLAAFRRFASR